ncbi:MAG TPA: hypothetical protein VFN35_08770 [Ktedonobacteraceae bacterium]|nr:hypothetical protein [Ktedonobacteraceae bacterium]
MSTTFDIPFTGDKAALLNRAKSAASEAGATLTGDVHNGDFSGKGIEGSYKVGEDTVHVTITKKPLVIPESKVESELRKFFEGSHPGKNRSQ